VSNSEPKTSLLEKKKSNCKYGIQYNLMQAGSEAFKSITRTYYKGVACALLVYDITKRDSYANVSSWLEDLKQNGSEGMQIVLIGNKSDMEMK
jgi:GTPase SAR1 family protein